MKPRALVLVLAACAALAAAEPVDLVVMIDVSASMAPYFADVVDYFIGDLMRGMLQSGDRFHLISFAGLPEIETRDLRVDGEARGALVNKVRLIQPIGLYTDLVRAVLFLQTYTEKLPATGSRQLVLITDGVHDPPPGSEYAGDQTAALARLLEGARSIRRGGWYVHILGMPPRGAGPDQRSFLEPLARVLEGNVIPYSGPGKQGIEPEAGGLLEVHWPGPLGTVGRTFALPLAVENRTSRDLALTLSGVRLADGNLIQAPRDIAVPAGKTITVEPVITLPAGLAPGDHQLAVRLETTGAARLYPLEGTLALSVAPRAGSRLAAAGESAVRLAKAAAAGFSRVTARVPLPIFVAAAIVLLALLLILTFGLRMSRHGSAPPSRPVGRRAEKGPLIEMLVSLQSSRIGFRNIRGIEPGRSRSVGGGWSAFLVFLVPLPRRIAEISFDGVSYTFRVIRRKLFPGVPEALPDCLGADIPLVSDKGFPIIIRFVRYVSPLERIHLLLRAVHTQGASEIPRPPAQPPPVDTDHRFL